MEAPGAAGAPGRLALTSGQQEVVRWLAIGTMVVDHVGAVLLPAQDALALRAVGRLAWPLFAFLLAYNVAVRRVDPVRYLAPLAVWCAVSALPHYLAFDRFVVNIMGTLLLGAVALVALERWERLTRTSPLLPVGLLAFAIGSSGFVEYGPAGVALVVVAWWALARPGPLPLLALPPVVAWQNFPWVVWPAALAALVVPSIVSRLPLSLPRSGRLPWVFYPAHLALLALIDGAVL